MILCPCGKPMGWRATTCQICREAAKAIRRKCRMAHKDTSAPEPHQESAERVERLLASVDARKRRQRWAA